MTDIPMPTKRMAAVTIVLFMVFIGASPAGAQDDTTTSPEQELVDRYSPIIAVRPQSQECDVKGEEFTPAPADLVLDNPHVVLRQIGVGDPVLIVGPSSSDLFEMGGAFFIDFPGDAFKPGCVYEQDFDRYNGDRNSVVYAHIARQEDLSLIHI